MSYLRSRPRGKKSNPMAESWKPEDKATEAAFENPAESNFSPPTTEASERTSCSRRRKTHGEAGNENV